MKKVKYFLIKLFYKIFNPIRKFYWFIFRPNTRGVKCAIDFNGKILFVRLSYAHKGWTLPGGGVKRNESFEEAAKREAKEETNIDLDEMLKIGEYKATTEYKNDHVVCFYSKVSNSDFKVDGLEIVEGKWCDPNFLPEPFTKRLPLMIELLKSKCLIKMNLKKAKKIYFLGIGGIGISAVARMMLGENKQVSGSDLSKSEITDELQKLGAKIFIGQNLDNIPKDADLIIYSAAIEVADKEFFKNLKDLPIDSISYAEALSEISKEKFTIAISGTHGKTTTTAMIAKILLDAKLDPTVIVGSILLENNSNFIAGMSKYLVVEADDYRRAFLNLFPTVLVVNNIDEEHLDYYKNLEDEQDAFAELIAKVPKTGSVITDFEHPNIKPVLTACKANLVNFSAVNTSGLKLKFPGKHNIKNAQAAIAVAAILEVPREEAIKSLNDFKGTWRRFEYKGETAEGALVYDDYAHNPQKIQAALQGVREIYPDRKIIAVFQPHLYSRTKTLLAGFSKSFSDADKVILAPIFPAREAFDSTISSEILAEEIKKNYPNKMLRHIATFEEIAKFLKNEAKKGDIIIFLGAGDLYKLAEKLVVER